MADEDVVMTEEQTEALFNEMVAKRAADKAGETPSLAPEPATPPAEPAPTPVVEKDAGATQNEPAAAKPAAEEAKVEVEKPQPDADLDAILDTVPQEKRDALAKRLRDAAAIEAENKRLEHANRSMAGRVSAFQKKLNEVASTPAAQVAAKEEDTETWKQFKEDYPDISKVIEERLSKQTGNASPDVTEMVEYVREERKNRFLTESWDAVEDVHNGWRETVNTPSFREWYATSPTYEKLANSDDLSDAIALMDLYSARTNRTPAPSPADVAASSKLAARRDAQAEGARSADVKGATPDEGVDAENEDQAFAFYAAQANKRIRARNS